MEKKREKQQGNNKGFSLVELIVVIAIMGILAVTLTPTLTRYIDKARQGTDKEVVSTVYQAVKLALVEDYDAYANNLGTGKTFVTNSFDAFDLYDETTYNSNNFAKAIKEMIGASRPVLKSKKASSSSTIMITITDQQNFKVELKYNGSTADYTLPEA